VKVFRLRAAFVLAVALAAAAAALSPTAGYAACVYPSAYPGDDAAKAQIAAWMAGHAVEAGLPGELPVMAGLASTELHNYRVQDADDAGYFLMRVSIWDSGDYAGFRETPALQVQWFIDHALAIRQQRIAAGNTQYGQQSSGWGEWIADVERPAEQYRYRYQLRLDDARALIASGCSAPDTGGGEAPAPGPPAGGEPEPGPGPGPGPGTGGAEPDAQLIPESVLPALRLTLKKRQPALRAGALTVTAVCTNEKCLARAAATIAVPRRGLFRLSVPPRQLKKGERMTFRLVFGKKLRREVAASLRRGARPLAAIRVVAANAGGYRISASRTVTVG
jgi:hypothetical protein